MIKKGKCTNFGNNCSKADSKEIIELDITEDFKCPECGQELMELKGKDTKKGPNKNIIIIAVAAVILLGGGIAAFFLLKDSKIPVSSLILNPGSIELKEVETQTIGLTVLPENATDKTVQWTIDNASVASIENGTVTALAPGTATITVVANEGKITATCLVTVVKEEIPLAPVLVSAVTLNKTTLKLEEGATEKLEITILPDSAANKSVEWSSSDSSVATIDENGTVTAIKKGTAVINAGTKDGSKQSVSCTINVEGKSGIGGGTGGGGTGSGGGKDLGYAQWTGKMKNGLPHDTQGTLKFKSRHIIDSRDPKQRVAGAGDRVIGEFENGHLVQGRWYKTDGNVESIIIGSTN